MQYSNTSIKNGLLQDAEFWTGLGDAGITGNATLKAQFTNLLNRRYERALSMLKGRSQIDDTNYTNQYFSLFNIVSGINDYQFSTDQDGNTITDITGVLILESTTATDFKKLDLITFDNQIVNNTSSGHLGGGTENLELIISPNTSNSGVPTGYIERNNTIYFDKIPNYSKTQGGKLFYNRVPSYFVIGDTTKKPGFDENHHRILSLGMSYDWIIVNKGNNQILITRLEAELSKAEEDFRVMCELRNPIKGRLSPFIGNTR